MPETLLRFSCFELVVQAKAESLVRDAAGKGANIILLQVLGKLVTMLVGMALKVTHNT